MTKLGLWTAVVAIATLSPTSAQAADPSDGSLDYTVASWNRSSGLPDGGITALLAAADGSLWVGMDTGLYRFDGLRFVRAASPQAAVTHLQSGADGSVWVALADGDVARVTDGHTTLYGIDSGLPGTTATALLEDEQHRLWLGTRRGLYLLQGERWMLSAPPGLPEDLRINGGVIDRAGDMLLSANDALYRRAAGHEEFTRLATFDTQGTANGICATAPDRVYVTDQTRGFAVVGRAGGPESPTRSVGLRVLCDTGDNVWVGTGGGGLWRIPPATGSEPPHVLTGMLGEVASSLAEDAHGNIWVGTPAGLSRLSPNPMVRLADLGVSTAIASTANGHLWVGTLDGLVELVASKTGVRELRRYLQGRRIRALHAGGGGALWIASEQGITHLDVARRVIRQLPAATALRQIDSLSTGRDGELWIADAEKGLFTWNGTQLAAVTLPFDIRENAVNTLHVDRAGRTWMALEHGVAVRQTDGHVDMYEDAGRGRSARRSRSILEDSRHDIWVGGVDSLAWFSGSGHWVFTQADGFPVDLVKGLGEDGAGNIWIATDAAIVSMRRSEFERTRQSSVRPFNPQYARYDGADGAGVPRLLGDRSVTATPDGVLWFITGNGITGIDPRQPFFHDTAIPTASIVSAVADGRELDVTSGGQFSSRTRALRIDYSALNINSPHRTRFRYRLRGFDDEWQDAGARMTAFYTNLPPGSYEFEVAASDQINAWAAPTGLWQFSVQPVFYQTRWFPLACAGLVALAGWGVWRFRLAQVRSQFNIVLGERVRLSREIHDTLLQSLVGVAVQCEVLAKDVEKNPGTARDTLIRLRRQVESHIREFRQAVSDLRAERDDFISAIRNAGETAGRMSGVHFDLVVRGRPRPSPEEVERQLVKIAREAVSNAARHAQASSIVVEVGYDETSLRLHVRDDGRGFDPEQSLAVHDGHCGLMSMRERASEIGARLSISSAFGQGTQVEAIVPLSPA